MECARQRQGVCKILSKTQRQRPLLPIVPTSLVQAGDNLPGSPTSAHCCFGVSQVNQVNMIRVRVRVSSRVDREETWGLWLVNMMNRV